MLGCLCCRAAAPPHAGTDGAAHPFSADATNETAATIPVSLVALTNWLYSIDACKTTSTTSQVTDRDQAG
jgi:hypothetical protein